MRTFFMSKRHRNTATRTINRTTWPPTRSDIARYGYFMRLAEYDSGYGSPSDHKRADTWYVKALRNATQDWRRPTAFEFSSAVRAGAVLRVLSCKKESLNGIGKVCRALLGHIWGMSKVFRFHACSADALFPIIAYGAHHNRWRYNSMVVNFKV